MGTRVYVGNLAFSTSGDALKQAFEQDGRQVKEVKLVTDRDTGQPRGFAFVEMTNDSEAEKAIAGVNGTNLGGRTLNVNEARPKPERSSRGGHGGRY